MHRFPKKSNKQAESGPASWGRKEMMERKEWKKEWKNEWTNEWKNEAKKEWKKKIEKKKRIIHNDCL